MTEQFRLLLSGLDTVQAAYYLRPELGSAFSFEHLMVEKERLRANKSRCGVLVNLGGESFLVQAFGSKSGYPLVVDHTDYTIECGEFNDPAFFVTYRSKALWHTGAAALHAAFLVWAESVGLRVAHGEKLSRVDFAFDYWVAHPQFDSDCVVSLSAKDAQYRGDRQVQTIQYGKGDVVLRIYNKIVEIQEQSDKVWLFDLWGEKQDVWRIEWQVRKDVLRRFGLRTFADLFEGYGDALRWLSDEHDSLRVPNGDSNRSRWPLHPLWTDLIARIATFPCQGTYSEVDEEAVIRAQLARIAISIYGYHKRVAALVSLRDRKPRVLFGEARAELQSLVERVHEPITWEADVEAKRLQSRFLGT